MARDCDLNYFQLLLAGFSLRNLAFMLRVFYYVFSFNLFFCVVICRSVGHRLFPVFSLRLLVSVCIRVAFFLFI